MQAMRTIKGPHVDMQADKELEYCCDFMRDQLTYTCKQHGDGKLCPDVVVSMCSRGTLMLIARNAEYHCAYCPACGTAHQPTIDYRADPNPEFKNDG